MRGPGQTVYSDEVEAAAEVSDILGHLDAEKIEIALGRLPDGALARLRTGDGAVMKRRRLDILRVLLAKAMVAEAKEIRYRWRYAANKTHANGRRYGDLMFSARALLPPGYAWDAVTYKTSVDGPVPWDHQLVWDGQNLPHEGAEYDPDEAAQLLEEAKGGGRPLPEYPSLPDLPADEEAWDPEEE